MADSVKTALVVGATGVIGRGLMAHLEPLPDWRSIGASRRPPAESHSAWSRYLAVDLLDPADARDKLAGLSEVTHVFYTAFVDGPDQASQVAPNLALLRNCIEALDPADVTVVDGNGRMLAPGDDRPGAPGGAPGYQARIESQLAGRIESILEKTVGLGRVAARVRAEMDWTSSETTEEVFDPDSQVARSEQRTTEQASDGSEGGVPGIASMATMVPCIGASTAPGAAVRARGPAGGCSRLP